MTFEEIEEDLGYIPDRMARLQYVVDLGKQLPDLPDEFRIESNLVKGCMSKVWMAGQPLKGNPKLLEFFVDSDSHFVKGFAAIVLTVVSAKTPQQILQVEIEPLFKRLNLEEHISPQRKNGLFGLIGRIHKIAEEYL